MAKGKDNGALIIVDVQPRFMGDESKKTKDGPKIIPVINGLIPIFNTVVVACHEWQNDALKNPHLDLRLDQRTVFVHKSEYSAFYGYVYNASRNPADNNLPQHKLLPLLKERKIEQLFVCGIFTEWCVCETALDGVKNGFTTHLVEPGCAGCNSDDKVPMKEAMEKMHAAGVVLWTNELIAKLLMSPAMCVEEEKRMPELTDCSAWNF